MCQCISYVCNNCDVVYIIIIIIILLLLLCVIIKTVMRIYFKETKNNFDINNRKFTRNELQKYFDFTYMYIYTLLYRDRLVGSIT